MPRSLREELAVTESLIGVHFPEAHRRLLLEHDGWEITYGDTRLRFFGIEEIRSTFQQRRDMDSPGLADFVAFAADGGRRLIGYDRRVDPSPVMMIDTTADNWSSAMLQGTSFDGFLGRMETGKGLDFSSTYASPAC